MSVKKMAVLDGYTLNPGDLSWDELKTLAPSVEIHDRTAPAEIVARAQGAELVLSNKVRLTAETIAQLPDLKYIGVLATGFDVIDVAAAKNRGIVVSNVPAYSTHSVMQVVFGFILEWTHHIAHHAQGVRGGAWAKCPDFAFWDFPLTELNGKTLGIIGFGKIGQTVGRVGHAFGMKILTASKTPKDVEYPVRYGSLDDVFAQADFLSLLCPLTPDTRGLVNRERLKKMKKTAYLINTARGPVVNEAEVARALNEGLIAGFGADVLSAEPPPTDNPLLSAKNALITPHFAWASVEARQRLMQVTLENIRAFLAGTPQNVVSQ
jgi:glycerate dehydrogenase